MPQPGAPTSGCEKAPSLHSASGARSAHAPAAGEWSPVQSSCRSAGANRRPSAGRHARTKHCRRKRARCIPTKPAASPQFADNLAQLKKRNAGGGASQGMVERRSRPLAAGAAAAIAMAAVAVLVAAVVVVMVHGDAGSALLGAADFNSISGQGTIFWGEEEGSPGRYPPEYAAQMKRMRRLVKRVKLNNDRSKALLGEEAATLREIRREMATAADEAEERLMTNVDNFKPEIAQLATKPGPAGPQGLQGFPGKRGFNGWAGLPGRPGARSASPLRSSRRRPCPWLRILPCHGLACVCISPVPACVAISRTCVCVSP